MQGLPHPATFRLQGLTTLLTVSAPRSLAGPVSSRQRSWDSPLRSVPLSEGSCRVSATARPACRLHDASAGGANPADRTRRPRLPGGDPPESPWPAHGGLARRKLDAPLGFSPFQGNPPAASSELPSGLPSHASPKSRRCRAADRHLRVSISDRLAPLIRRSAPVGRARLPS